MGTLLVTEGGAVRVVPLGWSTLVGRGPCCLVRMVHPGVPIYWLEIRWLSGGWAWRALSAPTRTRGSGARIGEDWRALTSSFGRGAKVVLDDGGSLELVDASPPAPFAVDLLTGEAVPDGDLEQVAELRPEGIWPLDGNGGADEAFRDGQVFVVPAGAGGPRMLRAHVPEGAAPTVQARIDLERSGASLSVDLDSLRATILQGRAEVGVRGECVRVLAVFSRARQADVPRGGWLTPAEAWDSWLALGGTVKSSKRRIEWERSRLRGRLAREGVAGVDRLFEVSREGDTVRTRLGELGVDSG